MLILRDAFAGMTRFDAFQKSLGIAPNILSRRLDALVAAGLLVRRRYATRPVRHEYVLTERGRDFRPVLLSLQTFGNRHFAPEGASVILVDAATGVAADPVLIDRVTGAPITVTSHRNVPGPAAGPALKRRLAAAKPPAEPPTALPSKPRRGKPAATGARR